MSKEDMELNRKYKEEEILDRIEKAKLMKQHMKYNQEHQTGTVQAPQGEGGEGGDFGGGMDFGGGGGADFGGGDFGGGEAGGGDFGGGGGDEFVSAGAPDTGGAEAGGGEDFA
jgi:hypothetical protein